MRYRLAFGLPVCGPFCAGRFARQEGVHLVTDPELYLFHGNPRVVPRNTVVITNG